MIFMFPLIKISKSLSAYERGLEFGKASALQAQHSRITYARLFATCGISWAQRLVSEPTVTHKSFKPLTLH
jgi:hypothetical protein